MAVTIKDVAKHAGVSPSTVSRVISDSGKISEKTKQSVRYVMKELGYHVNWNARVLVRNSTQTIGIVMKHSASRSLYDPFFSEVLRGISQYCHQFDYHISLTTGDSEADIYKEVIDMVQGRRVDGLIVLYSKADDPVVSYLHEQDVPFAVIGKPLQYANEIMYVDNDNIHAAKEATAFLIEQGHEEIGFIGDDPEFQVVKDRMQGFRAAMKLHGLPIKEEQIACFTYEDEGSEKEMEAFINKGNLPSAFLLTTDINAVALMKVLRKQKISVPESVGMLSFNNTLLSDLTTPSLSSIDIQTYQLGYEASKGLIELIKEPNALKKSIIIPTILKIRESHRKINIQKSEK